MEIEIPSHFRTSFRFYDNECHCYFHLGREEHGMLLKDIIVLRNELTILIEQATANERLQPTHEGAAKERG
jgi:hypothetical protein